jgi:hypothetical protein
MVRIAGRYPAGLLVAALALSVLPALSASAADEAPGKLTDTWIFWVKPGQGPAFQTAVKGHLAWRKSSGEPFQWNAYQPVVGEDLTHFVFRSGPHHWKDFDDNLAWEMKASADQKFEEQVAPYVSRYEHVIDELDTEHSSWTDSPDYRYFGVSFLQLKPGTHGQREAALSTLHAAAQAQKWPLSYAISSVIGGGGGMTIVSPYKSYADMAEPDPSFFAVVAKALGSAGAAGAAFDSFGRTIQSESYTIYVARPDLSTPK